MKSPIGEPTQFDPQKKKRINALWELSKKRPLTEEELTEQKALREEYLAWFRSALRGNAADKTGKS